MESGGVRLKMSPPGFSYAQSGCSPAESGGVRRSPLESNWTMWGRENYWMKSTVLMVAVAVGLGSLIVGAGKDSKGMPSGLLWLFHHGSLVDDGMVAGSNEVGDS